MSPEQIGWCAGFFDGEGNVHLFFREARKYSGRNDWFGSISVSQKIRGPLEFLQAEFGGNIHEIPRNGQMYYKWILTTKKALPFLEVVRPHLQVKGARADCYMQVFGTKDMALRQTIYDASWA